MSKPEPQLGFLQNLYHKIETKVQKTKENYNIFVAKGKQLELQLQEKMKKSVIRTSMENLVLNRYHGMKELNNLPGRAKQGLLWLTYLAFVPQITLQKHVANAATEWTWDKARNSTGRDFIGGFVQGAFTVLTTTSTDIQKISNTSQSLAYYQIQTLVAGSLVSVAISSMLKRMAQNSTTEITRQLFTQSRRAFRFTGVIAVAYGLGCITDTLEDDEMGAFSKALKKDRDQTLKENFKDCKSTMDTIIRRPMDRLALGRIFMSGDRLQYISQTQPVFDWDWESWKETKITID